MRRVVTLLFIVGCSDPAAEATSAATAGTAADTTATSTTADPTADPPGESTSEGEGDPPDGTTSDEPGSGTSGGTTGEGGSDSSSTGGDDDGDGSGGSSSSSTGAESLVCGDGIVGDDEECDDGDNDDTNLCANDCTFNAMLVFVSSTLHTGNMGGLEGADGVCQDLADDAGLEGTFLAWLSTEDESPSTRFTESSLPYVLVDGTVVADDWDDLTDSSALDHAIDLDENGDPVNEGGGSCSSKSVTAPAVFSNSFYHGGSFGGGESCTDWTSNAGSARYGMAGDENPFWSMCGIGSCGTGRLIYCFEQ